MSSHQTNKDKPRASKCHHFCHSFDVHNYCPTCREVGKGDDPCVTLLSPCNICASFTEEQQTKITHRKRYIKRGNKKSEKSDKNYDLDAELLGDNSIDSFAVLMQNLKLLPNAFLLLRLDLNLFLSRRYLFERRLVLYPLLQVRPYSLKFSPTSRSPWDLVLICRLIKRWGAFQASMLEAFNNLRKDFQKSLQKSKQVEVDQTSSSASKPNPSHSKTLDPSKSSAVEAMDVDYGPELPPCLDPYDSRVDDASGHPLSSVEEPSRVAWAKPKKSSHSHKHYDVVPSSASNHYSDPSDDHQTASRRPKKHSDKSKHKSRSRFLPSSSGEDQSPECRYRSPKPSRKSYPDQEHPQYDPDPPYYREVALSDIPSQYAEEVDTLRRILRLPDPRESLPRSSTAVMGLDDEKGRQEALPLCCLLTLS